MPDKRDCLDCGQCDSCIERAMAYAAEQEADYDGEPEEEDCEMQMEEE